MNTKSLLIAATLLQALPLRVRADQVVQIPVASILNTRSVTTLTAGRLVTWQVGIDGGGNGSGYLTMAASLSVGDKNPHALPDSGRFPADARHPEIVLNWSNADSTHNQTRYVRGAGEFDIPIPPAKYARMFLCFTSAEGASSLQFQLTYEDSVATQSVELPDYFNDLPANDPVLFYVAKDLAKWSKQNKMTEATHHNIDGIELRPAQGKVLTGIKVKKAAKGYLVFWGATGVALTPVSIRRDAPSVPQAAWMGPQAGPGRKAWRGSVHLLDGRRIVP